MPNHFLTVGLCGRDYERLEKLGKDDVDLSPLVGVNLCELVSKLPGELEGIVASNPPCRYRHKETGEFSTDCNSPLGVGSENWERVDLTDEEVASLRDKYGAANWYEWQSANWGTKWGTYGLKVYKLGGDGKPWLIEFQTAWSPPSPWMMRMIDTYLCDTYCLKSIKWIGHEPYDSTTVDIELAD